MDLAKVLNFNDNKHIKLLENILTSDKLSKDSENVSF